MAPDSDVPTDIASQLLDDPEFKDALVRDLRIAFAYPVESEETSLHAFTTTVFASYGAVALTDGKADYRLFGVARRVKWFMVAATPVVADRDSYPTWLDVSESGSGARLVAVYQPDTGFTGYLSPAEGADDVEMPDWVVPRIPWTSDPFEPRGGTTPPGNAAVVRLVRSLAKAQVPEIASRPLPAGYTASPHTHPGIGRLRQFNATEFGQVLLPRSEAQLYEVIDRESHRTDFMGPRHNGPVSLTYTTWNADSDFSALVNTQTHRALQVRGLIELRDPVWRGRVLSVDLVFDAHLGIQPTLLHCEIDWKSMKVRRVVPYGPLSPLQ
jgi:hypothetical protein